MFVVVEVCDINPASALNLTALEEEFPGVSVILNPCLSQCEFCAEHAYAFVNGEIVSDDDPESLLNEIRSRIEAALAQWTEE
ncbi:MAG: DUF1450 domain-containing protein [Alicyclobacillaceae bacterium]|nr:DUF1450 domain-containing protein [Alicyclobacillaceae bacterium]